MSERIIIPIPQSQHQTRIEVYYKGELNRYGAVEPGATEINVKLPAPVNECEIKLIPYNASGQPCGRGHVYRDKTIMPEPLEDTAPPVEPSSDDECCEKPDNCTEVTEIVPDASASVVVERPEDNEVAEPPDEDDWTRPTWPPRTTGTKTNNTDRQ